MSPSSAVLRYGKKWNAPMHGGRLRQHLAIGTWSLSVSNLDSFLVKVLEIRRDPAKDLSIDVERSDFKHRSKASGPV